MADPTEVMWERRCRAGAGDWEQPWDDNRWISRNPSNPPGGMTGCRRGWPHNHTYDERTLVMTERNVSLLVAAYGADASAAAEDFQTIKADRKSTRLNSS